MYLRISGPLSESLSIEPENNTSQAEEENQAHVGHNRRNITTLDNPRGDELRESVAPNILVDRNGDENGSCDWLVRIDRVSRRDGREGSDLDTSTSVTDDHNYLFLVSRVLLISWEY